METPNKVDMVTFEILRHRLEEVVAEMYHTIVHVSGNPTLYEAGTIKKRSWMFVAIP